MNIAQERRILVTGARGQLGSQLCATLGDQAIGVDIEELNLTNFTDVDRFLKQHRPRTVIHTAAYTAVDAAEDDRERCWLVNADVVQCLADATNEIDCGLVQISTDYVHCASSHPGRPFREDDPIAPAGQYALSKAAGEEAAKRNPRHLIVRTCGIYGPIRHPRMTNFVNTMLKLGKERPTLRVVADQICCPTWVTELAAAILHLVQQNEQGIFHVVNPGGISWFEFAQAIMREAQLPCQIEPISTVEYGAKSPRPAFSELDISRYLSTNGPKMSGSLEALQKHLRS